MGENIMINIIRPNNMIKDTLAFLINSSCSDASLKLHFRLLTTSFFYSHQYKQIGNSDAR
jgi:hypothetical protein